MTVNLANPRTDCRRLSAAEGCHELAATLGDIPHLFRDAHLEVMIRALPARTPYLHRFRHICRRDAVIRDLRLRDFRQEPPQFQHFQPEFLVDGAELAKFPPRAHSAHEDS